MRIIVEHNGEAIWMRDNGTGEGIACTEYIKDGTQQKIITALEEALQQAEGEKSSLHGFVSEITSFERKVRDNLNIP